MGKYDEILTGVLKDLHNQTNRKHDVYYQEGKGALFVPEGYKLEPRNVVYKIDEMQLRLMSGDISSVFGQFSF